MCSDHTFDSGLKILIKSIKSEYEIKHVEIKSMKKMNFIYFKNFKLQIFFRPGPKSESLSKTIFWRHICIDIIKILT